MNVFSKASLKDCARDVGLCIPFCAFCWLGNPLERKTSYFKMTCMLGDAFPYMS